MVRVLRSGVRGDDVSEWQHFLLGEGYKVRDDRMFGPETEAATREFQRDAGLLVVDGVVGARTLGAAMAEGFDARLVEVDAEDRAGPAWPPMPEGVVPIGYAERQQLFGAIESKPASTLDPDAITITNNWTKNYITPVNIPQITKLAASRPGRGWQRSGKVLAHRFAANQLLLVFQAWDDAGLLNHLVSFDGLWVPRYVRGAPGVLSSHAYGTAIDLNARYNQLGHTPALTGQTGCLRELISAALACGFWWGGWRWGPNTRIDGMHLELFRF